MVLPSNSSPSEAGKQKVNGEREEHMIVLHRHVRACGVLTRLALLQVGLCLLNQHWEPLAKASTGYTRMGRQCEILVRHRTAQEQWGQLV